jgi:hypothetical protein
VRGAFAFSFVLVLGSRAARADCPTTPDDRVCRPWTALLVPTAFGELYEPHDDKGPWVGGGLEAAIAWSDNSPAFGPSQGKLRFDIGALGSTQADQGTMAMYRGGAQVSFERNASRDWLIPYFAADLGGLWTKETGSRLLADGGLGVYILERRAAIVDLEVDIVLPFTNAGQLGGVRTQLAVSYALW